MPLPLRSAPVETHRGRGAACEPGRESRAGSGGVRLGAGRRRGRGVVRGAVGIRLRQIERHAGVASMPTHGASRSGVPDSVVVERVPTSAVTEAGPVFVFAAPREDGKTVRRAGPTRVTRREAPARGESISAGRQNAVIPVAQKVRGASATRGRVLRTRNTLINELVGRHSADPKVASGGCSGLF